MPRLPPGRSVALDRDQANYLGNVLRLSGGARILVFNGRDGEWQAEIAGRKRPDSLTSSAQTRKQDHLADVTYVFAPLNMRGSTTSCRRRSRWAPRSCSR